MNRGFALLGAGSDSTLASAIQAYDEAIGLLEPLASVGTDSVRNSLGAAWMNRGVALHRQGTAESITESIRSQRQAAQILQTLPLDDARWYRRNRAASAMNLANALLDSKAPQHLRDARVAALEAIAAIGPLERTDREAAEVGMKSRRALCDAIGRLLVAPGETGLSADALAAEATDVVDDALALARVWEKPAAGSFRPLVLRLFHFGTQLYRIHQPHFLVEFVRENLDATTSPDAEMRSIAAQQVQQALAVLEEPQSLVADDPKSRHRMELWNALRQLGRDLETDQR